MRLIVDLVQVITGHMGIDLGREYVGVTLHLPHLPNNLPMPEHFSGSRITQLMEGTFFCQYLSGLHTW